MRVFVTGGSGFIGRKVVTELRKQGHDVLALARSERTAHHLVTLGAEPHNGDLKDVGGLATGARNCDAVVHLAFTGDYAHFQETCAIDVRAIEALGRSIAGTDKILLVPNGLAGLAPGRVATEEDGIPPDYAFPRQSEQMALRLAADGVNAMVVRLAQVHSHDRQGLVTGLIALARKSGVSAFIGDGAGRWPAVHLTDAARLFRLALERPERGARLHAVAEDGLEMRAIAEAIGAVADVPTRSISADDAPTHFGPLGMFVSQDMPASSDRTREKMNWQPTGPGLLSDLNQLFKAQESA